MLSPRTDSPVTVVLCLAVASSLSLWISPHLGWFALLPLGWWLQQELSARPWTRLPSGWASLILSMVAVAVAFVSFTLKVAVPNILEGGRAAAEKDAVACLRVIHWAENEFRTLKYVDADGDGLGEFAFLRELLGDGPLRSGQTLPSPVLDTRMNRLEATAGTTLMSNGGYLYIVYLPSGSAATSGSGPGLPYSPVDVDSSERHWVAYAWPRDEGHSGDRVYFINQDEEVLVSDNTATRQAYSGPAHLPPFDAALVRAEFGAPTAVDTVGGDGGQWRRWKKKKAHPLELETPTGFGSENRDQGKAPGSG